MILQRVPVQTSWKFNGKWICYCCCFQGTNTGEFVIIAAGRFTDRAAENSAPRILIRLVMRSIQSGFWREEKQMFLLLLVSVYSYYLCICQAKWGNLCIGDLRSMGWSWWKLWTRWGSSTRTDTDRVCHFVMDVTVSFLDWLLAVFNTMHFLSRIVFNVFFETGNKRIVQDFDS